MIHGTKVQRPLKEEMAAEIAALCGLPDPNVSRGSSVESQFLDAVHTSIAGEASGGADAYRKTEALLERLALPYDPYWDTSEAAPTGGGSTVTNRAYSRIRAELSATPRCFILNVTDAPVGARWEQNHQEIYRYDGTVTGRRSLNDAGPGSRIIYYATSKSRHDPKHMIASAVVAYIHPGWRGPWVAQLSDYTPFPAPVPVDQLELVGWNRQHAITEITYDTYRALVAAGGLLVENPGRTGAVPAREEPEVVDLSLGAGRVAERVAEDFPIGDDVPGLEIPDALPAGEIDGGQVLVQHYTETATGVVPDDPDALPARPRDPKRDKVAEQRAVEIATTSLSKDGWLLLADRQKDGVGYDLEFVRGGRQINVEVKGITGRRLAFNITPKELWRAQTDPRWVLVAVTGVLTPGSFELHLVTRDRIAASDRTVTGYRLRL